MGITKLFRRNRAVDPVQLGLVPDEQVSALPVLTPELATAKTAAAAGDWRPAAELLASTGTDWDLRAYYVGTLGKYAADDDDWLKSWRAADAGSGDLAVVHAESLISLAWEVRSGKAASEVSMDQFAAFHRILGEAEQAARAAAELLPADPTPWMTIVTLARGLQFDAERFEPVWSELIARAPHHRRGHEQALQYWCDKWFGSHEQMFDFADAAAAASPSLAGLPLLAALEYWISEKDAKIWTALRTQAAADAVREWLAGDGATSTAADTDRGLAAMAFTFAERGAEAVEQFRELGTRANSWAWAYFGDDTEVFLKFRRQACEAL